jgi:hypothetical protein
MLTAVQAVGAEDDGGALTDAVLAAEGGNTLIAVGGGLLGSFFGCHRILLCSDSYMSQFLRSEKDISILLYYNIFLAKKQPLWGG